MALIRFQIDFGSGFVDVAPPKNHSDTKIQRIWNNGAPSATVQAISYEWLGDTAKKLNAYKAAGLTGGTGIFEGPGLRMFIGSVKFFEGCIDTANKSTAWECDRVKGPIKETGRIDWLKTVADSLTFAHLRRIGVITTADYKKVPYTLTSIPDGPQLTMLLLQETVMVHQLLKEIVDVTSKTDNAVGSAIDLVTPPWSGVGSLFWDIFNAIAEIIYCGTLFIGILKNGQLIFDQVVQTQKFKYAMRVEDLFIKACSYLQTNGVPLQFSSTIFRQGPYKDLTIMPRKTIIPKSGQILLTLFERSANEVNSPKAYGHPDGSLKKLIDDLDILFNTAPVVDTNMLYMNEKNSYAGQSSFVMPNTGPEGYTFNYPDPHGTNASELAAVYALYYQVDESDLNTIHQYQGTSMEITMLPTIIRNRKNLLTGGLKKLEVPFAHAKRKEYLTNLEQVFQGILNLINGTINALISIINGVLYAINNIIGWFGGSSTTVPYVTYLPTNVMNGRIGYLELTGDVFTIPKIFIGTQVGNEWHIHPNNATLMAAETIVNTFHTKELATRGGQWKTYGDKNNQCKIKYCLQDDLLISKTNGFTTVDNKKGKFESLTWAPEQDIADAYYRVNEDFTTNLTEDISVDGD